jgi:hypothetical protein
MSTDVQQIVQRWKVRPTGPAQTSDAASSPAPDLHAQFLRLRADMLRKDPLVATAPSIDDELANALDKLRVVEVEYQQARTELAELHAAYQTVNDERVSQRDQIIRLQNELDDCKRSLFELKEREKVAAANVAIAGTAGGGGGGHSSPPLAAAAAGLSSARLHPMPVPMIRPVQQRANSPRGGAAPAPTANINAVPFNTSTRRSPVVQPGATTPKAVSRGANDSPRRPLGL